MFDERPGGFPFHAMRGGFGGDPLGGFGFARPFGGRGGFGGRRERLFDAGDIKLVVLKLLSEQPSYGYQLIKTMEERMAGGYAPSAGVIYPTLTMLEEEGLAVASLENNRKVYSVTPEGMEYLHANERRVTELFERLDAAGKGFERERSPEIIRAFMNLSRAIGARVARRRLTRDEIRGIAEAINTAASAIDEL